MKQPRMHPTIRTTLCFMVCLLLTSPVSVIAANSGNGQGANFVPFQAADNWGFADPAELIPVMLETISCAGSDLTGDPEQPCPPDVNVKMRNLIWAAPIIATDPRMTGFGYWSANANWDPEYSGPVWGTWTLYVEGEDGVWDGTWSGYRRSSTDEEECLGFPMCWIGELKLIGHGSGGSVEGLQVKALEKVQTFSPLPAPYENICLMIFGEPCALEAMPEGILSGRILVPGGEN